MSIQFGCVGAVVDAKTQAVGYRERFGFRPLSTIDGEIRRAPISMHLDIRSVPEPWSRKMPERDP
jgi:hypothetical protein